MDKLVVTVEASKYLQLKRKLIAQYPEADEDTLVDTLEGITDLHEMIAAVIRSALVDEALRIGLRSRLDDMKERLSRLELRASKKRELALRSDDRGRGSPSWSSRTLPPQPELDPRLSWSSRKTIPEAYWLPQPSKLDRQAILGELKRGIEIPGVEMSNPKPVLSVRTK